MSFMFHERNKHQPRDMEDPMVGRRQGEPVLSIDDGDPHWIVMLFGVVCSDGTTEFDAHVVVSRAEYENLKCR